MPPKGGGRGRGKADAAVEEEPAAKTEETNMPPKVRKGKAKADAAVEEEPAAKKAAIMQPKVGKDVPAEPAAKTAATIARYARASPAPADP